MLDICSEALLQELKPTIIEAHEAHKSRLRDTPLKPLTYLHGLVEAENPTDVSAELRLDLSAATGRLERAGLDVRTIQSASLLVGTLTEDNLPHYVRENDVLTQRNEPMNLWLNQWTAEEAGHGRLLGYYAYLSGLFKSTVSLDEYETGQNSQALTGMDIKIESVAQGFAYLSLQEFVTRVAHANTAPLFGKYGHKVFTKIAQDESRHHAFYFRMTDALLDLDADRTVIAIRDQYDNFEMPGRAGIPDFEEMAKSIAVAGIYDAQAEYNAQANILKRHKIEQRTFRSEEAKKAQEELVTGYLSDKPHRKAERRIRLVEHLRERKLRHAEENGKSIPLILGRTVRVEKTQSGQRLIAALD